MIIINLKSNVGAGNPVRGTGNAPTRELHSPAHIPNYRMLYQRVLHNLATIVCIALMLFLAGCGGTSSNATVTTATATPAHERVNGFGTTLNHPHSLLALPDNVLLLATHYGLFRSADAGSSWTEVAA